MFTVMESFAEYSPMANIDYVKNELQMWIIELFFTFLLLVRYIGAIIKQHFSPKIHGQLHKDLPALLSP